MTPPSRPVADAPRVSFVIPAFNEANHIEATLQAIEAHMAPEVGYEVIVVDNGSTDATAALAAGGGAEVLSLPEGFVGAVRNLGANRAAGAVLIFLDADVRISAQWGRRIRTVLDDLSLHPQRLYGSRCAVPEGAGWLQRVWFGPIAAGSWVHVDGAHTVMTRAFFCELGGFDEGLETGEDYDLTMRALRSGGALCQERELLVFHDGYPDSLAAFVRREMWHGRGDFRSWSDYLHSRVALMSTLFFGGHLLLLAGLFGAPAAALTGAGVVAGCCLASAVVKFRHAGVANLMAATVIYYLYFAARIASGFATVGRRFRKARE